MSSKPSYYAGQYVTDEKRLLWVVKRLAPDIVLVEDASTGDRLEVGDGDLAMYRLVKADESGRTKDRRRRKADSGSGG